MSVETLVIAALSAIIGWVARHYGVLAPVSNPPQPRQGAGGNSLPGPAQADLPGLITTIVSSEVQKGVAYLEGRLLPRPAAVNSPQP